MAQTVPQQHPSVVLRTHYAHLRVILIVALIALVAMTVAVVVLATSDDTTGTASSPAPITAPGPTGNTRYDGGPEEGSRGTVIPTGNTRYDTPGPTGNTRFDGGPEEGSRGIITPPGSNYNGPH